jgi:hypothetical protein
LGAAHTSDSRVFYSQKSNMGKILFSGNGDSGFCFTDWFSMVATEDKYSGTSHTGHHYIPELSFISKSELC